MRMAIITEAGQTVLLPESVALDDAELSVSMPASTIPGKHGRRRYKGLQRVEPRPLRASGILMGWTREEAEELAETYRSLLIGKEFQLKRYAEADRFIVVECTRIFTDYLRGRYRAEAQLLEFQFEASDPFWYGPELTANKTSAGRWNVTNAGTWQASPKLTLTFAGTLEQVVLRNHTTDQEVAIGNVASGDTVVIDTEEFEIRKNGNNILHLAGDSFLVQGFQLEPGENDVRATVQAGSLSNIEMSIEGLSPFI